MAGKTTVQAGWWGTVDAAAALAAERDGAPYRINGKCKQCKAGHSALVVNVRHGLQAGKGRVRGAVDEAGNLWIDPDYMGFWARCECGKALRLVKVQGKVNHAIKCNGKCEGATGHVCECSCGGRNHGRAHG